MNGLFQMMGNASDGVMAINEDQQIIYWNQAAEKLFGYAAQEVMGRQCADLWRGRGDLGRFICGTQCGIMTTALKAGSVTNYDCCIQTKSGETRWVNVSILTTDDPDNGHSPVIIHLFRDATQKKQNEEFVRQVLGATEQLHIQSACAADPSSAKLQHPLETLTEREQEVLSLLVAGHNTSAISGSLSISVTTTRNHVQNILHKLQVHSRVEAVAYALQHGYR